MSHEEAARAVKVDKIVTMLVDRFPLAGLTENLRAMHEGQRLTIAKEAKAAGQHNDRIPSDTTWEQVINEIAHCELAYTRGQRDAAA